MKSRNGTFPGGPDRCVAGINLEPTNTQLEIESPFHPTSQAAMRTKFQKEKRITILLRVLLSKESVYDFPNLTLCSICFINIVFI